MIRCNDNPNMINVSQSKGMTGLLRAGLFLFVGIAGVCARPLEILFVGNSYVYVNNLPDVFTKVAAGAGLEPPHVAMHAPGGQTLTGHCSDANLMKILAGHFDVVILQEQSEIPAMAETNLPLRKSFIGACQRLSNIIHQQHPDTKIVLFQTWARHASAWKRPQDVANLGSNADEMQARLSRWYAEAGRQISARVAPVGDAWRANYHSSEPALLHDADGSHPSPAGTYLTALVLVGVVYDTQITTRYTGPFSETAPVRLRILALTNQALRKVQQP